MITLKINGETRAVPPPDNLVELLTYLGISQGGIAVEVNRRIIRRKDWQSTPISDADKVEIVQFVGGG
jgi:sulfur carrier protein